VEFAENVVANYVTTNYYEDSSLEYDTEYFYRVSFFNGEWSEVSDPVSISIEFMSVDVDQLPDVFALHQNYPNPFNPVTNLSYDLPEDALVNITIYDMMGKVVSTLVNGQQSAGFKTLQWSATIIGGIPLKGLESCRLLAIDQGTHYLTHHVIDRNVHQSILWEIITQVRYRIKWVRIVLMKCEDIW
jgi:hypothetical protein